MDGLIELHGRAVVAGEASGVVLATDRPLSWWGGVNPATGEVIDRRHPLSGERIGGRILVFPFARGSSSTSSAMLETLRAGTAPAAIVNCELDPIVALGVVVSEELWGRGIPVILLGRPQFDRLRTGDRVHIRRDGTLVLEPAAVHAVAAETSAP